MTQLEGSSANDDHKASHPEGCQPGGEVSPKPKSGQLQKSEEGSSNTISGPVANGGEDVVDVNGQLVDDFLSSLSDEQRERAYSHLSVESHFSGPLPPPEQLAAYDAALPGGAERIVSMAEKQLDAAIRTSDAAILDNHKNTNSENWALRVSSFGVTFFPWVLLAAAGGLAFAGLETAALYTVIGSLGAGGAQVVTQLLAVRGPKQKTKQGGGVEPRHTSKGHKGPSSGSV